MQPGTLISVWDTGQLCKQSATSAFGTQGSYATKHPRQSLGHRAVVQPHSQLYHRLFHIQCITVSFALRGLGINFAAVV